MNTTGIGNFGVMNIGRSLLVMCVAITLGANNPKHSVPNPLQQPSASPIRVSCCLTNHSCVDSSESTCLSQGGTVMLNVTCEGDGDSDGFDALCGDGCPGDSGKTAPGICGCGVSDVDTDMDGAPNCTDGCPSDGNKTEPGICGCAQSDVDTDGDTVPDCNDVCDGMDDLVDEDGNGVPDCTAGEEPIPTVTGWGIFIMSLLLITAGKIRFGLAERAS